MVEFGTDLSTPDALDIDPMGRTVSGLEALAQALARRFVTRRGSLKNAPAYGYDLRLLLADALTAGDIAAAETRCLEQLRADERVDDARVSLTFNQTTERLRLEARVTTAEGPFRLVLDVSEVTAKILAMEYL